MTREEFEYGPRTECKCFNYTPSEPLPKWMTTVERDAKGIECQQPRIRRTQREVVMWLRFVGGLSNWKSATKN